MSPSCKAAGESCSGGRSITHTSWSLPLLVSSGSEARCWTWLPWTKSAKLMGGGMQIPIIIAHRAADRQTADSSCLRLARHHVVRCDTPPRVCATGPIIPCDGLARLVWRPPPCSVPAAVNNPPLRRVVPAFSTACSAMAAKDAPKDAASANFCRSYFELRMEGDGFSSHPTGPELRGHPGAQCSW